MNVEAIPEIINIFANSQNVSISKGKSHFLMRDTKKFRKRKWPDEEMKMEDGRQKIIDDLSSKIAILKKKIDEYNQKEDELLSDRGKLVKLYEEGIIDSDGEAK